MKHAVVAAVAVLLLALAGGGSAGSSHVSATPSAQGRALVQQFFTLLRDRDLGGLRALLAPGFQVVRANGLVQDRASYLAAPPKVDRFTITKLAATRSGDVLVVSYRLTVSELIAGREQPTGPAPRLTVFQRLDGAWRLVAHANFGAIRK